MGGTEIVLTKICFIHTYLGGGLRQLASNLLLLLVIIDQSPLDWTGMQTDIA